MQNKGPIRLFLIILGIVCVYQLFFTWKAKSVDRIAEEYAVAQADKVDYPTTSARDSAVKKMRQYYFDSTASDPVINLGIGSWRPIQYTYPLEMPLKDKINAIATKIYRADGVNYSAAASKTLAELTDMGYGNLPVCIAKTQYSFSDNAKLIGAPTGFTMEVREVRLAAGAGFVVVICGNIMTMPGLPKKPAAVGIDVDADGKITGLF